MVVPAEVAYIAVVERPLWDLALFVGDFVVPAEGRRQLGTDLGGDQEVWYTRRLMSITEKYSPYQHDGGSAGGKRGGTRSAKKILGEREEGIG